MFRKPSLFQFSGKGASNLVCPKDRVIITVHHRNSNLLRYAPENKSSPRVVTGKWLLKIEKLTTMLNNKSWTIPQIKNHKMCHGLTNRTTDTTHKSRTHVFKVLGIANTTVCGENYESSS